MGAFHHVDSVFDVQRLLYLIKYSFFLLLLPVLSVSKPEIIAKFNVMTFPSFFSSKSL